ncbi:MAG: hypothetical protein COU42_00675 [Candidatus Nealsonbacteria bacterium CG10_big_fil_rev_8_21_14_0_10_36_24]|uniref:Transmembrane protein n=2 Tax=Candidatus Nealsoniibacteriota TaxID=1817911 RepID=A0A2H0YN75_9BACT|nr:MAG: hypothetical protein COU42_00675 [Candidatus Nealsonbacteria bacterium CG10_big_fil_rev_8_21_14_0_10_36_24]PIS39951.1 MAG: hypothetical protein COT32_02390 [Candidatus Nealsonbacteria bacterium CG08_land_8_20_14_0_20_36_22]
MNKKISFPITIIIIVVCAILVGYLVCYYIWKPFVPFPPQLPPPVKYAECSSHYVVSCFNENYSKVIKRNIPCSDDNDCSLENMNSYCSPGYPNILKCIGAKYYCGEDGFCKGCDCPVK